MKNIVKTLCIFFVITFVAKSPASIEVQYSSNAKQTVMIELFTSQGCSSCPPAEAWLNTFTDDQRLWKEVVPIALHVDYWDKLGWPDPYANHAYSMRQYRYQQQGHINSVYTPGVVVNGQEWRGWIYGQDFLQVNNDAGVLSFKANKNEIEVNYTKLGKDHVLNITILGNGINTQVERGENSGKSLEQEFVVLTHKMYSYAKLDESMKWVVPMPMLTETLRSAEKYAIAVWVSDMDNIAPIQSTGYWLPKDWFN